MKASNKRAGVLTKGDGDRAMFPMEALSTSNEGSSTTQSDGSGLILILNFFLWSSSSSDSSEEKKWGFLVVGGTAVSRKPRKVFQTQSRQLLDCVWDSKLGLLPQCLL